jgi:hypothetical protein
MQVFGRVAPELSLDVGGGNLPPGVASPLCFAFTLVQA